MLYTVKEAIEKLRNKPRFSSGDDDWITLSQSTIYEVIQSDYFGKHDDEFGLFQKYPYATDDGKNEYPILLYLEPTVIARDNSIIGKEFKFFSSVQEVREIRKNEENNRLISGLSKINKDEHSYEFDNNESENSFYLMNQAYIESLRYYLEYSMFNDETITRTDLRKLFETKNLDIILSGINKYFAYLQRLINESDAANEQQMIRIKLKLISIKEMVAILSNFENMDEIYSEIKELENLDTKSIQFSENIYLWNKYVPDELTKLTQNEIKRLSDNLSRNGRNLKNRLDTRDKELLYLSNSKITTIKYLLEANIQEHLSESNLSEQDICRIKDLAMEAKLRI